MLAIAERESSGNPAARSSKTIKGLFQMRGDLRQQYGIGDSEDPDVQAQGYMPFFKDTKAQMAGILGRAPTDAEVYIGHHFGAGRGARALKMDPHTPVNQLFTPTEMAQNPHFGAAGTIGDLNSSITADIDKRRVKFGAEPMDFSGAVGAEPMDFSSASVEAPEAEHGPTLRTPSGAATGPLDFASQAAQ